MAGYLDVPGLPDEQFWRSLRYFSYYRLVVASLFFTSIKFFGGDLTVGSQSPKLFLWISTTYLVVAAVALIAQTRWRRAFNMQLTLQVTADIALLTILLYASGGVKSGIAMMLLVVLVGAGLVGQGRLVLFYAALATVSLLSEQSYRVLQHGGELGDFFRTGLTSIGFFGSAIAARLLARRVVANEELARKRGVELADQMRISERIIRDMQVGVLVIDASGRVRQSNPQAAFMFGFSSPHHLPVLAAYSPTLAKEYDTRRSFGAESEIMLSVPQTGRTLRARFLPPGEGGNMLVFLEDAGRLQEQATQIKLAALGRLTANMAHEIRNPLAAISHAAELLDDEPAGKGVDRLVRIIGDNSQRLNRLVSEVMELGRRDRASPELVDIKKFLLELIDEVSLQDATSQSRVTVSVPEGFTMCFDRGHLHRVITNLLSNALHYASNQAGAVSITGERAGGGRSNLHVVDDGAGIDEVARNQVFEPFFTTRAKGTGLGLYIARELCEANGAHLSMLENSPGAHFCISCAALCLEMNPDQ